jgi:site-specific DNA-methyltransferase (adenine-specific)
MTELVKLFTDPGDVVLDPFAGSGSTLVACVLKGRVGIGFEKNTAHVATANARLEAARSGISGADTTQGQLGIFA